MFTHRRRLFIGILMSFISYADYAGTPCQEIPQMIRQMARVDQDATLPAEKKLQHYQQLYQNLKKCSSTPDSIFADLFRQQGKAYYALNKLDSAIFATLQGYELLKNKVSSETLGKITYNLGYFYSEKSDFANAITFYAIAAKSTADPALRSSTYKNAADASFRLGDYEKGIWLATRATEVVQPPLFPFEACDAYNILGLNQFKLERFEEAGASFHQALQYYYLWSKSTGQNDPRFLAPILINYGGNSIKLKQYLTALAHFKKASELYQQTGDTYNLIRFGFTNLGYASLFLHDTLTAQKYYEQGINRIKTDFPNLKSSEFALLYDNMAMLLSYQNKLSESIATFKKALSLFPGYRSMNDSNLASIPFKQDLHEIISDYGKVLFLSGRKQNNLKTVREALTIFEYNDQLVDYMRREQSGTVSKLFWREKTQGLYERAIEACYLLNDPTKAFYFFEKSRAVLLNDQLNELGARQQLSPPEKEKERRLHQQVAALLHQLNRQDNATRIPGEILNRLLSAQEELETFVRQLEKTRPLYYAYKYDNRVPSLAEVRKKLLTDHHAFITYFTGEQAVYGLCITPKTLSLQKINGTSFAQHSTSFQRMLSSRESQNKAFGSYLTASYRLYELLLKPFALSRSTRVIISPDGNFIPFEALSSSPSEPRYLLFHHAFSYAYSAGLLTKSHRSDHRFFSPKTFFGLAPVHFPEDEHQASLPGSDASLDRVKKEFFFSKIVTHSAASRKAFTNDAPDYRIVQLLTHASADSTARAPQLYFADSPLSLSELNEGKHYATQLLVLSACRTGIGKNQKGEGIFSLARGFSALGIPSVLTTLWSVENQSVYGLTELFYQQIGKGLPLDVALQQAQIEWLQTASRSNQLPYSWAGIVLIGNSEPVSFANSLSLVIVILALTLILFLSRWLWIRKVSQQKRVQ